MSSANTVRIFIPEHWVQELGFLITNSPTVFEAFHSQTGPSPYWAVAVFYAAQAERRVQRRVRSVHWRVPGQSGGWNSAFDVSKDEVLGLVSLYLDLARGL